MTTVTAPLTDTDRGYRYRWMVLTVVMIADVMDLLDATIANLAGPSIRADLGGSESTLQWVLAAYTVTFAVGLITSARAGDLLGRRRLFIIGMAGFTLASLLSGLAPTAGLLIAARVAQGFFGAVMIPQGLAMVKASFHPDDLQKAFVPFGPIMGLSAVLGPIVAGFLIDADLWGTGWRMVFLINIPIGVVSTYLAWRYLPDTRAEGAATRMDPLGTALLTVASGLLIYPLVQGREHDWAPWTFAMMAASAVAFAAFVLNERRSSHPVIEPTLFDNRGFVAGTVFMATFMTAMTGFGLVLNLFTQLGLGFSPLKAGVVMVPWALGIAIGAVVSGAWAGPKYGRHVLHVGLAVLTAGVIGLWWTVGHFGMDVGGWDLVPALLVAGFGCGLIFAPLFDLILADVSENEVGTGSGLLNALQQFGGAIGVAILGTVLFQLLPEHGWVSATQTVLWVSVGLFAASFLLVFALPLKAREGAAH